MRLDNPRRRSRRVWRPVVGQPPDPHRAQTTPGPALFAPTAASGRRPCGSCGSAARCWRSRPHPTCHRQAVPSRGSRSHPGSARRQARPDRARFRRRPAEACQYTLEVLDATPARKEDAAVLESQQVAGVLGLQRQGLALCPGPGCPITAEQRDSRCAVQAVRRHPDRERSA